jgi:uncharacterized protein
MSEEIENLDEFEVTGGNENVPPVEEQQVKIIPPNDFKPWGMEVNQFCTCMHLSQFTSFIVPLAGLVLPIVMWTTNKEKSEQVNEHGKSILNWMISSVIYYFVSIILMFVIIGFFTIFAVIICSFIFTIMGAVKANNGKMYHYPLTIKFIK